MKNGDVVYFKKAKKGSHRKSPEVEFKGHGFGVMLGHVPPFQKDPPPEHLIRLMGQIGFLTFDDVGELMGDEFAAELLKKYEDKYYGKEMQAQTEAVEEAPEPSTLLGSDGTPIVKGEAPMLVVPSDPDHEPEPQI